MFLVRLIINLNYPEFGEIHASPRPKACMKKISHNFSQKMDKETAPGLHIHISFLPLFYIFISFIILFPFGRDARVEVTGKVEIRDRCLMTWVNKTSRSLSSWKITKKYEYNYAYFLKIFRGQFLFFIFFIFIPSSLAAITGASTVKKISS